MMDFCFVVPVYKVPYDLLQNCIDSIIGQTHKNIELILVDDGSPDDCGKLCDENALKDERIKVIHKKNGGLSDARNAGTKACQSKWITYVDGDDWVDKNFVESFLRRIKSQKELADFYIYNGYRNYAQQQVACTPYYEDGKRFVSYSEREELQKECCLVPTRNNGDQLFIGSGWAKVFNIDFIRLNDLYFTIVPYGEDSIYFLYAVEQADLVEYVSQSVYHYRDTEGGMVNGFRKNADQEQDIYVKKIFQFAKKYQKQESFVDTLYLRVFIAMQRCVSQKFFNDKNPDGLFKRWKDSIDFFGKSPYKDIYRHIKSSDLNRNSKIKFWLLKFKLYGLMNFSRNIYNRKHGKKMCERK
ncbi:glycosyltransferase family 2 protein [Ruminococcus gauvreauii]|uniref:Glycosyltransferase n=1 Tax=Ruminococcus gauvreauii TaxID=438033 RepID=A0ABY5VFJ6_9FIRM|nr:glycosyltransferase family 2 protein [Ruminococcus gauvreauii]UWP59051.1 glycosyltransferase [Ruminococcus gauvreauii]